MDKKMDLLDFAKASKPVKVDGGTTYQVKVTGKCDTKNGKLFFCREKSGAFNARLYLTAGNEPSTDRARAIIAHGYDESAEVVGHVLPVRCTNLKYCIAVTRVLFPSWKKVAKSR